MLCHERSERIDPVGRDGLRQMKRTPTALNDRISFNVGRFLALVCIIAIDTHTHTHTHTHTLVLTWIRPAAIVWVG